MTERSLSDSSLKRNIGRLTVVGCTMVAPFIIGTSGTVEIGVAVGAAVGFDVGGATSVTEYTEP